MYGKPQLQVELAVPAAHSAQGVPHKHTTYRQAFLPLPLSGIQRETDSSSQNKSLLLLLPSGGGSVPFLQTTSGRPSSPAEHKGALVVPFVLEFGPPLLIQLPPKRVISPTNGTSNATAIWDQAMSPAAALAKSGGNALRDLTTNGKHRQMSGLGSVMDVRIAPGSGFPSQTLCHRSAQN
jgi:hypothetical protein